MGGRRVGPREPAAVLGKEQLYFDELGRILGNLEISAAKFMAAL